MAKVSVRNRFFYNFLASVYNKIISYRRYRESIGDFLDGFELKGEEPRILDAGCGTGVVSFAFASRYPGADLVAFDRSRSMLRSANKIKKKKGYGNVRLYLGDVEQVNPLIGLDESIVCLQEGSFDYIFASGVLEHADIERGVHELSRYLRPGGTLVNIGIKPGLLGNFVRLLMHFRIHSKEEVAEAFKKANLADIVEVEILQRRLRRFRMAITGKRLEVA